METREPKKDLVESQGIGGDEQRRDGEGRVTPRTPPLPAQGQAVKQTRPGEGNMLQKKLQDTATEKQRGRSGGSYKNCHG